MGRMTFVFRRLLLLVPTVLGVTIIAFFMIHLIPGDPARTILGIHSTPRGIAILHQEWGLNRPLASQYWLFMDRLFHGNLGTSLYYNVPVWGLITSHLPPTLWLICYAAVLAVLISVPLAMIAASRKDAVRDHVVRAVPLLGLGMPSFWLALILQTLLAVKLRLFPVTGYGSGPIGHLHSMFLPALTVAIALCPVVIRSLRASMLNVLGADFITTARAKGVPSRRLFVRHVLRNAVIPAVTVLGINIGFLIGGTLIVENVFDIPGIGQLMINAIFQRDFPVVQGVTRRRATWYRQPALMAGLVITAIILLSAIFAPLLTPYNPIAQDLNATLQGPSAQHWLGTDQLGRDVFTRLLYGARVDLKVGFIAVLFPFCLGTILGSLAGYFGGWTELVIMRLVDVVVAFPFYVLLIALVFVLGPGERSIYIAITIVGWVSYARLVRAEILVAKRQDYVLAAQGGGLSNLRIMGRHLTPNVISQAIIYAMSDIVQDILAIVTLGYFGLGIPPPTAEWGSMINEGQNFLTTHWQLATIPGLAVVLVGLGLSLIGDGLADLLRPGQS